MAIPAGKAKRCMFAFALLAVASAHGQTPTGSLIGAVTDPSGAVVPHARIEVSNPRTGFSRIVATTSVGDYSAPALPPGRYQVTVQAAGFQRVSREAVVETGVATTVNITVALEGVEQVVNVNATTPQLRYDAFDLSGVVAHTQVEQ